MKLDILIVDLVLVALVVIPYLLFILMGRREITKLKESFLKEAEKHKLHIAEMDMWNKNVIGVDKARGKILFVQQRKAGFATELYDLKEVKACNLLQEVQTLKINRRDQDVLQRIELQLILFHGGIKTITLYNCDETYFQDYELRHAETWSRNIKAMIEIRPTIDSAA